MAAGPDGKVNWIAQGFQSQLGLESQVVAGICEWFFMLLLGCADLVFSTPNHVWPSLTITRLGHLVVP